MPTEQPSPPLSPPLYPPGPPNIPLYIRNVAYDQWARITIPTSATVEALKNEVLFQLHLDEYDASLEAWGPLRTLEDHKRSLNPSRRHQVSQIVSPSTLSTAIVPSSPERSFLARTPDAVLLVALQGHDGQQSLSPARMQEKSGSRQRRASRILGGSPGRGGMGSLSPVKSHSTPQTAALLTTMKSEDSQSDLDSALTVTKTSLTCLPTPHLDSATQPVFSRQPALVDLSFSERDESASQSSTPGGSSLPTAAIDDTNVVKNKPPSTSRRCLTHLSIGDTDEGINVCSVRAREESQLEQPSVPFHLLELSEHDMSQALRGNDKAKKEEEEARKVLAQQIARSFPLNSAAMDGLNQGHLPGSAPLAVAPIEMRATKAMASIPASARRAQLQKSRALDTLILDDTIWTAQGRHDGADGPLRCSLGLTTDAPFNRRNSLEHVVPLQAETQLRQDSTSSSAGPRAGSFRCANGSQFDGKMSSSSSCWSSSDGSFSRSDQDVLPPSNGPIRAIELETRDEARLWGTQLEAERSRRRWIDHHDEGDDDDENSDDATGLHDSKHGRYRRMAIIAPRIRSSPTYPHVTATATALTARGSAPDLSRDGANPRALSRSIRGKAASVPRFLPVSPRVQSTTLALDTDTDEYTRSAKAQKVCFTLSGAHQGEINMQANPLVAGINALTRSQHTESSLMQRHPLLAHYCLLSFRTGILLDDSSLVDNCGLKPFDLLELQPQRSQGRVRLPRGTSIAWHAGGARPPGTPSESLSGAANLRSCQSASATQWPLLVHKYLKPFACGWAYVHRLDACPIVAQHAGISAWKLRWLVLYDRQLIMYRSKPERARITGNLRLKAASERDGQNSEAGRAPCDSPVGRWSMEHILWLDSELADGATKPVIHPVAGELLNVSFAGLPTGRYGFRTEGGQRNRESHIVSFRFLTDHQNRCWYGIFRRAHCRNQQSRRRQTLCVSDPSVLPLHAGESGTSTCLDSRLPPLLDDNLATESADSVDQWRQRAYLRCLKAGERPPMNIDCTLMLASAESELNSSDRKTSNIGNVQGYENHERHLREREALV